MRTMFAAAPFASVSVVGELCGDVGELGTISPHHIEGACLSMNRSNGFGYAEWRLVPPPSAATVCCVVTIAE